MVKADHSSGYVGRVLPWIIGITVVLLTASGCQQSANMPRTMQGPPLEETADPAVPVTKPMTITLPAMRVPVSEWANHSLPIGTAVTVSGVRTPRSEVIWTLDSPAPEPAATMPVFNERRPGITGPTYRHAAQPEGSTGTAAAKPGVADAPAQIPGPQAVPRVVDGDLAVKPEPVPLTVVLVRSEPTGPETPAQAEAGINIAHAVAADGEALGEANHDESLLGQPMFYVFGEVRHPGPYKHTGRNRVLDMIAQVKPTAKADLKRVQLVTPGADRDDRKVITINVSRMIRKGDTSDNYVIANGEILFVPKAGLRLFGGGQFKSGGRANNSPAVPSQD